ncbi:MAG: hypothetical protein QOJ81_1691 [Chloroflexota bacterium]|jgi:hypothetical protein|nr:hypothetical protein [Chloroflexota bacterium]
MVGLVFAAYIFFVSAAQKGSLGFDIVAYWSVDLANPYHGNVGDLGFFAYAPPIALVLAPFTYLPFAVFATGWYVLLVTTLASLGRRQMLMLLAFPPVALDLYHGNIHLLLAAAIVLGMRYPAVWSFVLLTKVTPGIGLLWFAARREWRSLAIALAATAAIAAVTFVALPTQWLGWLDMLRDSAGTPPPWPALPIPLVLRLPLAALIVLWGARRDARWTVPIAAALALPALWPGGFAILAACWPLRSSRTFPATADAQYHPNSARETRTDAHAVSA